ncbi:gamma-glutamyltransferase [Allohahella marinimesophila]
MAQENPAQPEQSGPSETTTQAILEGDRATPVKADGGMVVTSHYLASEEAARVLESGGNAVDAAVTAAFTLAVTQPRSGNIGGGGFMLISSEESGEVTSIDYRETAPAAASKDMFLSEAGEVDAELSRFSHRSSGVPGTVAGLLMALEKYGTISREKALGPAIRLAEQGFVVTDRFVEGVASAEARLRKNPGANAMFFKETGGYYEVGDRFRQPDLAETLRRISISGKDGFYKGRTAQLLVAEMNRGDGLITNTDLESYEAVERKPVHGSYRGYDVYSMGPPSSGGVHIIQILNMLEPLDIGAMGLNGAQSIHHMVEAMKRAYADRAAYLGDVDFVDVPLEGLLSKDYAKTLMKDVQPTKATPSSTVREGKPAVYESNETTHFSVADRYGNVVSNTYTINFSYGSHIAVEGAGFLLNNEMDDFSAKPGVPNAYGLVGGDANRIEPGKRMLSSMSPTIVKKGGKNFLVTGSPGGSRIITTTLGVIMNVIDHHLNIQSAVNAPRVHHQWLPDEIRVEEGISPDTKALLESYGHTVSEQEAMGASQSILLLDGVYYGGEDPRRSTSKALGVMNVPVLMP